MSSTLTPVTDGIWTVHHRDFSVGGLGIGTRTNVVRLPDGTLLLHSPGPLDEAALTAIRGLGPVSHLLAPNLMHHLSLARIAAAFPEARLIASPGLAKKEPTVRIDETLSDKVPSSLSGALEMAVLDGAPALEERVFFHAPTRTAIGVDLAFNLHGMTGLTRFAMWINNANERFCVTRLARSQFIKDAKAAASSVNRMADAWNPERVIVSHGDVLATGGAAALREAWSFAG